MIWALGRVDSKSRFAPIPNASQAPSALGYHSKNLVCDLSPLWETVAVKTSPPMTDTTDQDYTPHNPVTIRLYNWQLDLL